MNKLAIVTGGAYGIGKATAEKLANEGAKVVIFDVEEDTGRKVAADIGADFHYCDVSNSKLVQEEIKEVFDKHGKIDFMFINAGINGKITPIQNLAVTDWEQTIDNNLKSTFLCLKHVIPYMKENGGSIIITSSINGNRTFSNIGFSAYSVSKAGQMALGKMAALELAQFGIRVNIVCPGAIETQIQDRTWKDAEKLAKVQIKGLPENIHPLAGHPGKPEQVANLVCFLASDESEHITGAEFYIDGGESLV